MSDYSSSSGDDIIIPTRAAAATTPKGKKRSMISKLQSDLVGVNTQIAVPRKRKRSQEPTKTTGSKAQAKKVKKNKKKKKRKPQRKIEYYSSSSSSSSNSSSDENNDDAPVAKVSSDPPRHQISSSSLEETDESVPPKQSKPKQGNEMQVSLPWNIIGRRDQDMLLGINTTLIRTTQRFGSLENTFGRLNSQFKAVLKDHGKTIDVYNNLINKWGVPLPVERKRAVIEPIKDQPISKE